MEHGCFRREESLYHFDLSIARGECVGIYVDDHLTSGTACLDVFKGGSHMAGGRGLWPAAGGWARWSWSAGSGAAASLRTGIGFTPGS